MDWLLQSIKLKQPANEAAYRVSLPLAREPDAPSPSSKRTLRSMNHSFKQPDVPIKKKLFEANSDDLNTETLGNLMPVASSTEMPMDQDEEHNLISQYSQENVAKAEMPPPPSKNEHAANESIMAPPIATSTQWIQNRDVTNTTQTNQDNDQQAAAANPSITESCMTIDYENLNMFDGLTLYIEKSQFAEELYVQILNECEAAKGNMVPATFRDPVDYAIVSFERSFDISMLPVKAKHVVTDLYVVRNLNLLFFAVQKTIRNI